MRNNKRTRPSHPSSSRRHRPGYHIGGRRLARLALLGLIALTGCAVGPNYEPPQPAVPTQWSAPRPHGGELAQLRDWWTRLDDATLVRLIDVAQRDNPSLEAAVARIEQARANARAIGAGEWPTLTANASLQRRAAGVPPFPAPITSGSITADAAWEIDLFGAVRYSRQSARARIEARETEWHDARTSLAAEVALTYINLRACEAIAGVQQLDTDSRQQTVTLTERRVGAGFTAPADAALLRASLTDARSRLVGQRAECDLLIKALVGLTGFSEAPLREALATHAGVLPAPRAFAVAALPAAVLAQRPDLAVAERELAAAAAEIGTAEAARYPRVSLVGSIGYALFRLSGVSTEGESWSFGPALSLPILDGGRRAAQVDVARARFDELRALYMQRARQAVREVEETLVRLDAAERRQADAEAAVKDFEAFFAAAQTRWDVGVGNLIELEEARRQALNANSVLIQLRRDRVAQWVSLYKVLGGGWEPAAERVTKDQ